MREPLKIIFYMIVLLVVAILSYKVYLNLNLKEFEAEHTAQIDAINSRLQGQNRLRFAVVGNINNSIGIFEKQLIPKINQSEAQFLISVGNAVMDGGEDKYRALKGTFSHLKIPYLLTFGENEYESFGGFRFYEHYGPYYFSFTAANTRFIFLDSTSKTSWKWQIHWLRDLLESDTSQNRFIFIAHPPLKTSYGSNFFDTEDFLEPVEFRDQLLNVIDQQKIDAVFSLHASTYTKQKKDQTYFVTTGGAGGLDMIADSSLYHYVDVLVTPDSIHIQQRTIEERQGLIARQFENLWFFIYSFFYVGYLNFFLLVSVLILISIKLYTNVYVSRVFYPVYEVDPSPWLGISIRVIMFTDNYLPFIGGVPISVSRLSEGLNKLKHKILIVAPSYHNQPDNESQVLRVPSLLTFGKESEFRMANIFLKKIRESVSNFKPDIIHVHHPFWLGSLGLLLARWNKVPAVYTYHTRLEHYAHFVPLPTRLFRNLISHVLIRRFANKCNGIIVPTHSAEKYLHMIGVETPCFVQATGIEYSDFQQVDQQEIDELKRSLDIDDEVVFISVSRLSDEKNIDFMIDAIAQLKERVEQKFRFLMIGGGHERDRLQIKINKMELSGCITLVGSVEPDRMKVWYHLGDIFLFASKSETQGMVILEAMAAGLPVVAVNATGIDDVVQEGENGYKTPENKELWIQKVQLLFEDAELRGELSQNALNFAKSYSIEAFASHIQNIYATILAAYNKKN